MLDEAPIPLGFHTGHQLADAMARGELSCSRVIRHHIETINQHDDSYLAFIECYADSATCAAGKWDKAYESGVRASPLQGLPIALKDNIGIGRRGITAGSKAWVNYHSIQSADVVDTLINAGMIIVGKNHMVEFALGGWGTNEQFGTPRNPWDTQMHRIPGGSSSGSAVAVAAGMVPFALGSDTGGSIRIPASYCGLAGLRPAVGRISTRGVIPLSRSMDVLGPMARTVEDVAILYDVLRGEVPSRHEATDDPPTSCQDLRGMRLGCISREERIGVAPDVLNAYDVALQVLACAGAQISPVQLPRPLDAYASSASIILTADAYAEYGHLARDDDSSIGAAARTRLLAGARVDPQQLLFEKGARHTAMTDFNLCLSGFDAFITPTTPTTAIPLMDIKHAESPARFTQFVSYLNLCALAVRNGFDRAGLPTSMQIVCRGFEETTALHIGQVFECLTQWHTRRPGTLALTPNNISK